MLYSSSSGGERLPDVCREPHTVADDRRLRVIERESGLDDGEEEGAEARAALVSELVVDRDRLGVIQVGVVEFDRAHEALVSRLAGWQGRDVVEYGDPVAAPVRADLEAGAMRRERIRPNAPRARG